MNQRRRARAVWAALGAGMLLAAAASPPAYADLPARAYELVSPANKSGYPVLWSEQDGVSAGTTRLSADGDTAIYPSFGPFADAPDGMPKTYRSVRTATGWDSRVVSPRTVDPSPDVIWRYQSFWEVVTPDLRVGLTRTRDNLAPADVPRTLDLYTSTVDGDLTQASLADDGSQLPVVLPSGFAPQLDQDDEAAISKDGSRVYFNTDANLTPADAGRTVGTDLYERVGNRTLLLNQQGGTVINRCGSFLGGGRLARTNRNAVSSSGDQVIFTVPSTLGDGTEPDCFRPLRIYARSAAEGLVEVSASEASVPEPSQYADYIGASPDGTRIVFSSPERLIDGAPSGGIYVYDRSAARGSRLRLAVAVDANAIRSLKISDDARTLYFVSAAVVASGGRGGPALYVYNESNASSVTWIVDDPTATGDIGALTLRNEINRNARISADGRVLSFVSAAPLTGFDNLNGRTRTPAAEVFVYEDGVGLSCASCNPAGQRPSEAPVIGDAAVGPGNIIGQPNPRSITDDGKHVFFSSPDRLVAGDENSRRDIYEYSDGRLQLITSGKGGGDASLADISPSGDTILFSTADSLVPQDVDDGDLDMYVARVGGGFPAPPVPPTPGAGCDKDPCQGQPTPQPGDETPGSATLSGDDAPPPTAAAPTVRVVAPGRKALRSLARTGRAKLQFRSTGAGSLRVTLTARIGGKTRTVASARVRTKSGTSTVGVTVRLSTAARRALARQRRLAVRVSARFTNQRKTSTVKIVLRSSASPSRGGRR